LLHKKTSAAAQVRSHFLNGEADRVSGAFLFVDAGH
jgi:hypothetical protein